MMQSRQFWRRYSRRLLPLALLVALLCGCGGLWQAQGQAREDAGDARRYLADGWAVLCPAERVVDVLWRTVSGVSPDDPYAQLQTGLAALRTETPVRLVTEEEAFRTAALVDDTWRHRFEQVQQLTLSETAQVLLYHTHNAETYLPDAGVSKVSGQNGGVVQAADVFQAALEQKYGLRTVHNTTLHDYPDWNRSYQNSLATVKTLLQVNPDVRAVFDVHRDAGFTSKTPTTTTINGRSAARIMLVIGANHENWQQNLAFARRLERKCGELYPGLLRDAIHIRETGRYNQQVHPRAVLLEIGSDLNTQAEADYALECFAQVVAEVLAEDGAAE